MPAKQFKVGGDRNFGYLAWDEESKQAFIIDPSYSPEMIVNYAKTHDYSIQFIFNTHGHSDHTNGNEEIKSLTGKTPLKFDTIVKLLGREITDDFILPLANNEIKIIHTPGHTDDSMCIMFEKYLFTGDTLFVGKVGGTGFGKDAADEYNSLHDKLMTLPEDTIVYPGHDYGIAPESTIGNEKKTNPFILQPDFKSFLDLKKNWLSYKREHGIT